MVQKQGLVLKENKKMAQPLNVDGLTKNIKETPSIGEFINLQMIEQPAIASIHKVIQGVTMSQELVVAGRMSKMGIADTSCTRPNSGAAVVLNPKVTTPKKVGDTIVICQKDLDPLFKAYYDKITTYEQNFDITGSDEEKFIMALVSDSLSKSAPRLAWLGDTAVAQADAVTAGVTTAAAVKFYSTVDGLWKKLFIAGNAGTIGKVAIIENTQATIELQETLADGRSVALFEAIWKKASVSLRAAVGKKMLVSRGIFENYRQYLDVKGVVYDINITQNGIQTLRWNGIEVVNMETIWDIDNQADFVDNTTNKAYFLPNRIVLTVPENIPLTTLNENNLGELDSWYNKDERLFKIAFGYSLDALFLDNELIVVGY